MSRFTYIWDKNLREMIMPLVCSIKGHTQLLYGKDHKKYYGVIDTHYRCHRCHHRIQNGHDLGIM